MIWIGALRERLNSNCISCGEDSDGEEANRSLRGREWEDGERKTEGNRDREVIDTTDKFVVEGTSEIREAYTVDGIEEWFTCAKGRAGGRWGR